MSEKHRYRDLAVTSGDILGPFYRPGSPFRTKLVDQPTLFLSGTVTDTKGNPVSAYVDFWQADEHGNYDVTGPGFRGIQYAEKGVYSLETVKPGYYDISDPGKPLPHEFRCSHIHAKIWIDGVDILTTQLYFSDSPYDDSDHWFNKSRCIKFTDDNHGVFNFVVKAR
jgi:protocatechuate 3,4-dioxygenase beta subunit